MSGQGRWPRDQRALEDRQLEAALIDLGASLALPPTPDLATAVGARLRAEPVRRDLAARLLAIVRGDARPGVVEPRGRWRPVRRSLVLALVALLLLAAVAVAIRFGLPGLSFVFVSPSPSASAPAESPSSGASTGPTGSPTPSWSPGVPTTLSGARARLAFQILVPDPAVLPGDASVFVSDLPTGGQLVLAYPPAQVRPATLDPRFGLVITEFRGRVDPGMAKKLFSGDTSVIVVTVNGQTGYWITGAPHELVYLDAHGDALSDTMRRVGDTLVWEQDGLILRIETSLGLDDAQRIAASLH